MDKSSGYAAAIAHQPDLPPKGTTERLRRIVFQAREKSPLLTTAVTTRQVPRQNEKVPQTPVTMRGALPEQRANIRGQALRYLPISYCRIGN